MRISYDSQGDVLYLTFSDSDEECDYVENQAGIVLRIGMESGKILGCTIMWFRKKLQTKGQILIPEIGPFPITEELKRLVGV